LLSGRRGNWKTLRWQHYALLSQLFRVIERLSLSNGSFILRFAQLFRVIVETGRIFFFLFDGSIMLRLRDGDLGKLKPAGLRLPSAIGINLRSM
jgi:hypothetical protein